MSKRDAYAKKLQAQLDEWGAEIDKIKAKADKAEANAQLEYYRQIKELHAMQHSASNKLSELKDASDDAWEDLKASIDGLWDTLGKKLHSSTAKFK